VKERASDALVRAMVVKDPRQTADTILEFLAGANETRGAAIFSVDGDPKLFAGRGIAQGALDSVRDGWLEHKAALAQGRLSREAHGLLIPVLRRERLIALLYLETGQADLESVASVSDLIGEAVVQSARSGAPLSTVESYLEQTSDVEIERRRLLLLLERHEWNLSRVAREVGRTRATIYKRLAAFGISRRRVPKMARPGRSVV